MEIQKDTQYNVLVLLLFSQLHLLGYIALDSFAQQCTLVLLLFGIEG